MIRGGNSPGAQGHTRIRLLNQGCFWTPSLCHNLLLVSLLPLPLLELVLKERKMTDGRQRGSVWREGTWHPELGVPTPLTSTCVTVWAPGFFIHVTPGSCGMLISEKMLGGKALGPTQWEEEKQSQRPQNSTLHEVPGAAGTSEHRLGAFKQHKHILPQGWRPDVHKV